MEYLTAYHSDPKDMPGVTDFFFFYILVIVVARLFCIIGPLNNIIFFLVVTIKIIFLNFNFKLKCLMQLRAIESQEKNIFHIAHQNRPKDG